MKILFRIVIFLVVIAAAAYVYALTIPPHQTHTRTLTLKQTPEAIFALLTDMPNFPKWNRNMEKIEMLPPIDGKEATRQTFKGNMVMTIITSESTPPKHLVRAIVERPGCSFDVSDPLSLRPGHGADNERTRDASSAPVRAAALRSSAGRRPGLTRADPAL